MDTLRAYLSSLSTKEQAAYAKRCKTSIGYLRKAISKGQRLSADLCICLDRESARAVRFEDLRPEADWNYVRTTTEGSAKVAGAGVAIEEGA